MSKLGDVEKVIEMLAKVELKIDKLLGRLVVSKLSGLWLLLAAAAAFWLGTRF